MMGWEVGGWFTEPGRRAGGTYAHLWLMHADVREKPTQYCKAIILQLKINKVKNIPVWMNLD